ncbi:MAG: DUF2096 family protein [Candidatus Bathyarchaeia archaeon]
MEVWKVLEDLIEEFRKRGETVPSEIMEDLRSAKSLINVQRADPSHLKDSVQIEVYLENVESHLISKAQEKFGKEFADQWMNKIKEARAGVLEETVEGSTVSKFVPGVPRDATWIRVKISEDIPRVAVEAIAQELTLSTKTQDDGYLLVYGAEEKIKSFVKKLTEKFRGARKT